MLGSENGEKFFKFPPTNGTPSGNSPFTTTSTTQSVTKITKRRHSIHVDTIHRKFFKRSTIERTS